MSATPNKITLDLVGVEIHLKGGKTVINKELPVHEIRVLKALHGAGKVQQTELSEEMEPEREYHANAYLELGRLENVYRSREGVSPVQQAFPNGAEDLLAYGFTLGREGESAAVHNISVSHGLAERRAKAAERKANAKQAAKAGISGVADAHLTVALGDDEGTGAVEEALGSNPKGGKAK